MSWESYLKWREICKCQDCGYPLKDAPMGSFATETQCIKCWDKLGTPEKRGLPSAGDIAFINGVHPNG